MNFRWIDGKTFDDNAEGLWRIHDKLYDFTEFIDQHPGGKDWLNLTKGIDITEQFETHHIQLTAQKYLSKYYVKDATEPRNYRITFNDDGFYRTLKRRVREIYPKTDREPMFMSKVGIFPPFVKNE